MAINVYGPTKLAPYYDFSEAEVQSSYIKVLARPGKNIQTREINVLQGLLENQIKGVGDMIAKDGTIVEGCSLKIDTTISVTHPYITFQVLPGKVYAYGRVWDLLTESEELSTQETSVEDLPDYSVQVVVTYEVIDETVDSTLRSPALNYSNYNSPGAHRLKATAGFSFVKEGEEDLGVEIYRLVKGTPLKLPTSGAFSEIEPVLSRQTYDMHGNFLISGLDIKFAGDDSRTALELVKGPFDATITGGVTQHPYGQTWTNRLVAQGGADSFTYHDVGRIISISVTGNPTHAYTGNYKIREVITSSQVELDGQFNINGSTAVKFSVNEPAQNWAFVADAGKAYVMGHEITKPVSSTITLPKPSDVRSKSNEPFSYAFRETEKSFRDQPFHSLYQTGEGVTGNIYYGIGMAAGESGQQDATPSLIRGVTGVDDLELLLPGSGNSVVSILGCASSDATWEWHLDPSDPQYPGVFNLGLTGILFPQAASQGDDGWYQIGNTIEWNGLANVDQPGQGLHYKVMIVSTFVLDPDNDFRIRSNASARLYPRPGAAFVSRATSDALFFPQSTYDLTGDSSELKFDVDGVTVYVQFWQPAYDSLLGTRTVAPLGGIVNAINSAATNAFNLVGKTNYGVATAVYENYPAGSPRGWVVLQSFSTGSDSRVSIHIGNKNLGFLTKEGLVVGKSPTDSGYGHVLDIGATRVASLIPIQAGVRTLQADYDYTLYRTDLITVNDLGALSSIQGHPDSKALVKVPNGAISVLSLASVTMDPLLNTAKVTNYEILRTTMPEIKRMKARIENLEYNDAVLNLDKEAIAEETVNDLSGVLSDGFIGFSKADVAFNEDGVQFGVSIDVVDKEITLSHYEDVTKVCYKVTDAPSFYGLDTINSSNIYTGGRYTWSIDVGNSAAEVSQTKGTYRQEIFFPIYHWIPLTKVSISPDFNNYYDPTKNITIQGQEIPSAFVSSFVKPRVSTQKAEEEVKAFNINSGTVTTSKSDDGNASASATTSVTAEILQKADYYLPNQEIYVTGEGFPPLTNYIRVRFDGEDVVLTSDPTEVGPDTGTGAYTTAQYLGTVQAKADGKFAAKFTTPTTIARKVHGISVHVLDSTSDLYQKNAGQAALRNWAWPGNVSPDGAYSGDEAGSISRGVESPDTAQAAGTVGALESICGQTFSIQSHCVVNSVSLYFTRVDGTNDLTVQIREVVSAGTSYKLGPTIYGSCVVPSGATATITNPVPTANTLGTTEYVVRLDRQVLLEPNKLYAVVLVTWGRWWEIASAKVGDPLLDNPGVTVSSQPYQVGQFFILRPSGTSTTTNNAPERPTPEIVFFDNIDLKFKVSRCVFGLSGTLRYLAVNPVSDFTQFIANVESVTPPGTSIKWNYSVDGGSKFYPFQPHNLVSVATVAPTGMKSSLILQALLTSTSDRVSPLVIKEPALVATRYYANNAGDYITKSTGFVAGNEYSEVVQTIKAKSNGVGTFQPYFGYFDYLGATHWVQSVQEGSPVALSNGFSKYNYRTRLVMAGPDTTLPATLTSNEPPILNPEFTTNADFKFTVRYWDGGAVVTSGLISVVWHQNPSQPEEVVADINEAAAAENVLFANIASKNSKNQVVLTHFQSYGPQRCAIEVDAAGGNTDLGFANSALCENGTITATVGSGGADTHVFSGSDYAYYLLIAGNGFGSDQEVINDIDLIRSNEKPVNNQKVTLSFENRGKSLDQSSSELFIYRAFSNSEVLTDTQSLTGWKRISEVGPLTAIQLEANGFVPDNEFVDDGIVGVDPVGHPKGIALHEAQAYAILNNFRGRIHLATATDGVTPQVKDFTNVFVRTDTLLP